MAIGPHGAIGGPFQNSAALQPHFRLVKPDPLGDSVQHPEAKIDGHAKDDQQKGDLPELREVFSGQERNPPPAVSQGEPRRAEQEPRAKKIKGTALVNLPIPAGQCQKSQRDAQPNQKMSRDPMPPGPGSRPSGRNIKQFPGLPVTAFRVFSQTIVRDSPESESREEGKET